MLHSLRAPEAVVRDAANSRPVQLDIVQAYPTFLQYMPYLNRSCDLCGMEFMPGHSDLRDFRARLLFRRSSDITRRMFGRHPRCLPSLGIPPIPDRPIPNPRMLRL